MRLRAWDGQSMDRCGLSVRGGWWITFLWTCIMAVVRSSLAGGIPEPGLTMYGVVRNDLGGAHARMTSGVLRWTVESPSGSTIVVEAELRNINDQFSYVVEIPFESPVPGSGISSNALELQATAGAYDRSDVRIDGIPATVVGGGTTFSFGRADRARVERVDLDVAISYPDADGDGLPDFWETEHFRTNVDPTDDPDGDGLHNRNEYLAGCDPNDPDSAFLFVNTEPALAGGLAIRWSSAEGRTYTIERSANLLTGFTPLATGLHAAPPVNAYLDPSVPGDRPHFYRIVIE